MRLARPLSWLFSLALACLVGCDRPSPSTEARDVVARWDGGTLTARDIDRALAELPAERRPKIDDGPIDAEWRQEFIKELLVDRLLESEMAAAASDPALRPTLAEMRRNLAWEEFTRHEIEPIEPPSEAEVRAAFELWRESHGAESRLVRNIFLRRGPEEPSAELRQRAEALAQRARAGESFEALAREYSDSESRHKGGLLGFLTAEDLPAPVRATVFSLPEHEVSRPLMSRDGAHLFLVDSVSLAVTSDFSQAAPRVRRALESEAREKAIADAAQRLPVPDEPLFVVGREELERLIADGNSEAVILRRGDYELTLAALLVDSEPAAMPPSRRLQHLAWRERVEAVAESQAWFERPRLQRRLEQATRKQVGIFIRQQALLRLLDAEPDRLEDFYEAQPQRFSSPLRLHLERWHVAATGAVRKSILLALESYYESVGAGGVRWEAIVERHGGRVEDIGWVAVEDVADGSEASLLAALAEGEASPPHQADGGIEMERALERRDPAPRPFAEVGDTVREAYLADRGARLYRQWRDSLLAGAGVEIPDA